MATLAKHKTLLVCLTAFALLVAALLLSDRAPARQPNANSLVIGLALEPPHLDPTAGAAAAIGEIVHLNVFEGLTRVTADADIVPGLAERWRISSDGLTYTFRLRDHVHFHNGEAMTSADVQKSLSAIVGEKSDRGLQDLIVRASASRPL